MGPLQLIGPSYNLESRPASVQRTINMMPVPLEPGNERTAWVFKDVPGLSEFRDASLDGALFLDNFNGAEGTPIADHEPDVAPEGFEWGDTLVNGHMELDGDGNACTDGAPFDAAASGGTSIPLTYPYSLEIRAHRGVEIVSVPEEANFTVTDALGQFITIGILSNESNAYVIKCLRTGGSQNLYPVSGNHEHIGKVVVDETSITVYADGVAQEPVAFASAPTTITEVSIYASSESGATYRINRVLLMEET